MVAAVQWLVVVSSAEEVVCVTPRPGPGATCFPFNMLSPTDKRRLAHHVISGSYSTANRTRIIRLSIYFTRARSCNAIYPRKLYTVRIGKSLGLFYASVFRIAS